MPESINIFKFLEVKYYFLLCTAQANVKHNGLKRKQQVGLSSPIACKDKCLVPYVLHEGYLVILLLSVSSKSPGNNVIVRLKLNNNKVTEKYPLAAMVQRN